jgi:hypothetical protein
MRKSLEMEIQFAFDINAENYLEDDIHRGNDIDLICKVGNDLKKKLHRKIDILYVGVGPGEVLEKILTNGQFYRKIRAIDYSSNMCKLCASRIEKLGSKVSDIVTLEKKNLFDFDNCKESYDMILLLNNTLGNIVVGNSGEKGRFFALSLIHKLLRYRGVLFLTVYNFEKLEIKNHHYTPRLKLLRKNGQDLFLQLSLNGLKHMFYSHWFTVEEIKSLLQKTEFIISEIAFRESRIIITGSKMGFQ